MSNSDPREGIVYSLPICLHKSYIIVTGLIMILTNGRLMNELGPDNYIIDNIDKIDYG